MKARVVVPFTDKTTMADVYQVGDTFEGTKERVSELVSGGYVVVDEKGKKAE